MANLIHHVLDDAEAAQLATHVLELTQAHADLVFGAVAAEAAPTARAPVLAPREVAAGS